jgi:hypothetical protein
MDDMWDIATTQERKWERKQPVSLVDNEESHAKEDYVVEFQHCQNKQKAKPRSNYQDGKLVIRVDLDRATTPNVMANSVTISKSRATDKKNAERELKTISPAGTGKDVTFVLKCM